MGQCCLFLLLFLLEVVDGAGCWWVSDGGQATEVERECNTMTPPAGTANACCMFDFGVPHSLRLMAVVRSVAHNTSIPASTG